MAGTPIARLFAPLLLVMLSACIPDTRPVPASKPVRAPVAATARPVAVRAAPQPQPPAPPPAPVTSVPVPPSSVETPAWVAKPVTANAVTVPSTSYVVARGDTLTGIAVRTGASTQDIVRENNLAPPFTVKIGQKLSIPGGRYHRVGKGESGIAIARAYGVPWARIAELNKLQEPFILREGQRLLLPSQREAASMSIEQRAEAFKLRIDDIVTGGEPALATNETPAAPVATPQNTLPPTAAVAPPADAFDGMFTWPVDGKVIRPFGPLANGARNDGINIAAAQGTPIYAAADGIVAYVGTDVAIYGGLILLRHGDGWITAYGHAERLQVTRGQTVKKGQIIGYVAQAGLADQDQLHFEIRRGRTPVDPRSRLPKRG